MEIPTDEPHVDIACVTLIPNASPRRSTVKKDSIYRNKYEQSQPVTLSFFEEVASNFDIFCKTLFQVEHGQETTNTFDRSIKNLSCAVDIQSIIAACPELKYMSLPGVIICGSCFNKGMGKHGFFEINEDEVSIVGGKNNNTKILSSKFKSLKTHIRDHMLSEGHGRNALPTEENSPILTRGHLENKMSYLRQQLQSFAKTLLPLQETEKRKRAKKNDHSLLVNSGSITDLLDKRPLLRLYISPSRGETDGFDGIYCSSCTNADQINEMMNLQGRKQKAGFFAFNSETDTNTISAEFKAIQTKKFVHLKSSINDHFKSSKHLKAVQEDIPKTVQQMEFLNKNRFTGMALGKLAYKAVVRYQSKASFEHEVAFLADIGFPVGDINHSTHFVDSFIDCCYKILLEKTKSVLNANLLHSLKPSPFVVWADKITPFHTTQQIIGIITTLNGVNTPILLDIVPVTDHTGKGIAADIVNTLLKFFSKETIQKLYVGASFDGQYGTLKVPHEILMQLEMTDDPNMTKEDQGKLLFQTFSWDPAHLIELACGGIKKSKMHPWIEKTEKAIVQINRRNQYGKGYQTLLEEAGQLEKVLLRPGSFSETRFSTYKFEVLSRFDRNYEWTYNKLAKEKDSDLNLINSCQFVLRLCALEDVFKIVGQTSKAIQSSKLFPWQSDLKIEKLIEALELMAISLKHKPFQKTNVHLDYLNKAIDEIMSKGTFHGKPLLIQQTAFYATRSFTTATANDTNFPAVIDRVIEEVHKFVTLLIEHLENRFTKNHTQTAFVSSRESFSLDKILSRPVGSIPEEFKVYCDLARSAHFIESVTQESLDIQYQVLSRVVHHKFSQRLNKNVTNSVDECELYRELLSSNNDLSDCPEIVHLLTSATVRNKSECIAESLGSMIKLHLDKRCSLSNENLGMELFLHFNGPKPNRDCNGLVRQALNTHFGEDKWHFYRVSPESDLKSFEISKKVDKLHKETGRVVIPDTTTIGLPAVEWRN